MTQNAGYGPVGENGRPMCEECDEEMHPFAAQEGRYFVEGFGCDSCGWSFDTSNNAVEPAPLPKETP